MKQLRWATRILLLVMVSLFVVSGASDAAIVLKIANPLPRDNPSTQALMYFAELVKQRSNGEVAPEVFDNSTLGTAVENFEMLQLGTLEMVFISAGPASQFAPEWEIFSLPYVFRNREHMFAALNGDFGRAMEEDVNKQGVVFLGWYDSGDRNIITAKKPVASFADLKGLKIRVMESKVMVDSINALGAIATPMGQGEVYSALQQSVIDGWENNPPTLLSQKIYEVSPYYAWTRHFMTPDALLISKIAFDKLSAEHKKIVLDAAREASEKQHTDWAAYMNTVVDELKKVGCTFTDVKDIDNFIKAVEPVKESYKKKHGTKFIEMVNSYVK
ncbi:MAG: TRAP transporter substrate-binding protein [Synergistaceae bacterium]|jgi:tripartite ATP-independent transporter DctP family solute receptor|nr:TRAP transporter substrate-binding protein [Synergistaceae bacterium]